MAHQRGSLKKVKRKEGEIWLLRYRVTNSEGRRVENAMPIGLVREFPKDNDAWREADRLGLPVRINEAPAFALHVSFHFLAEHYLKADFGADAVRPKSVNTTSHVGHVVRAYLVPRFGHEIAEDIKPLDIQRWLKSLHESKWSCMDDDLQDAGRHAPHFQNRNPVRARREESRATRRDALEERLQGHRHHACANACNPEGPPLTSSLLTGADLCRYGAPSFGDSVAALVGLVVE